MSNDTLSKLVAAINKFGFKLFTELVKKDGDKNIFISPLSIATALTMTSNGASGDTRSAMLETLELAGISLEEVNKAQVLLRKALQKLAPEVELSVANSLWGNKGASFSDAFLEANREYYQAEIAALDFSDPASAGKINEWVNEKTNGKIENIVEALDPYGILALLNVIYFKGAWLFPFEKENTSEGTFILLDGSNKQVSIMSQMNEFEYYQGENFQAISLPYASAGVSMYIFLPAKTSSLHEFYQNLSQEQLEKWLKQLQMDYGTVTLPLFRIEYKANLEETLPRMGMRLAFDNSAADFQSMVSFPLKKGYIHIDVVTHKTFINVNEEGTEAAGATLVGGFLEGMFEPEEKFVMEIDRPFFYVIREFDTGAILFMGATVDPK